MWKPYLKVIKKKAGSAIHILDRFHIVARIHKAIDEVRAEEHRKLKKDGYKEVLKNSRWCLLKRKENLTENVRRIIREALDPSPKADIRWVKLAAQFHDAVRSDLEGVEDPSVVMALMAMKSETMDSSPAGAKAYLYYAARFLTAYDAEEKVPAAAMEMIVTDGISG